MQLRMTLNSFLIMPQPSKCQGYLCEQCWGGILGLLHDRQTPSQPSGLLTTLCVCECAHGCDGVHVPAHMSVKVRGGHQVSCFVILFHISLRLGLSQNLELDGQPASPNNPVSSYCAVPGFLNMGAGPVCLLTTICNSSSRQRI